MAATVLLAASCASARADIGAEPSAGPEPAETLALLRVDPPGPGVLLVTDLGNASVFDSTPEPVIATLTMRADDCIVAVIDGVEHVPIWPEDTQLAAQESPWGGQLYSVMVDAGTVDVGGGTDETPPGPFTAAAVFATGGQLATIERTPEMTVDQSDPEAPAWLVTTGAADRGDDAACAAATPAVVLTDPTPVEP